MPAHVSALRISVACHDRQIVDASRFCRPPRCQSTIALHLPCPTASGCVRIPCPLPTPSTASLPYPDICSKVHQLQQFPTYTLFAANTRHLPSSIDTPLPAHTVPHFCAQLHIRSCKSHTRRAALPWQVICSLTCPPARHQQYHCIPPMYTSFTAYTSSALIS